MNRETRSRLVLWGLALAALAALGAGGLYAAPPQFGTNVVIVDATDPAAPKQAGVDTSGNLKINCITGCSAGSGTGANNADGVASVGTGLGGSVGYNYVYNGTTWDRATGAAARGSDVSVKALNGTAIATGTGASSAGTQRVILSSDSALAANQSVNLNQVGGASVATGHGTASGALRVELPTDGTGVVGLAAGSNVVGAVTVAAAVTGGCTPYNLSGGSAASTNSTSVKGAAGTLCSLTLISTSATLAYVRIYDSASAPTCSSATGAKHSYPVPAATSGAGVAVQLGPFGELYGNGIGFCITGGGTDTDNTNAPTGVFVNASFK